MVLRGCYGRRQVSEAELFETRQETLLLLAAKEAKHELGGVRSPAPRHHRENEAGEISVIKLGDTSPSLPFGLLCALPCFVHFNPPVSNRASSSH